VDESRRLLLDRLRARNGPTLCELACGLDTTRQAVARQLANAGGAKWVAAREAGVRDRHSRHRAGDIEQAGGAVKPTASKAQQWDVPDAALAVDRAGWPAILSSPKSLLQTGKVLRVEFAAAQEGAGSLQRLAQAALAVRRFDRSHDGR